MFLASKFRKKDGPQEPSWTWFCLHEHLDSNSKYFLTPFYEEFHEKSWPMQNRNFSIRRKTSHLLFVLHYGWTALHIWWPHQVCVCVCVCV